MTTTIAGGGPLHGLIRYYERLQNDPQQAIADYGFSEEKIHFQIVLEPNGRLFAFEDIRETNERGKPVFRLLTVPDGGGRSGTSIRPFFCWDNTGYVLGRDNKGKPERAEQMFAAFRDLHLSMRDELAGDEGFGALCLFLQDWNPSQAEALDKWAEAAGLNVVFKLRGKPGFVHQSPAVRQAWTRRVSGASPGTTQPAPKATSLLTGQEEEVARLHPLIGGVSGANTTGAAIVSFNLDAFESYGKTQSYNAPVGVRDAFRYTTALNRLLSDNRRRARISDATVVFWADRSEAEEAELVMQAFFGDDAPRSQAAEDAQVKDRLLAFLQAAQQGLLRDRISDPESPFYILGLSPNASRLHVRYWLVATVEELAQRLARHMEDLRIGSDGVPMPPSIRRLIGETARDPKDIAPQLAGQVTRAVLSGWPYPQTLFAAVIRRVRADSVVNQTRAALCKAYLIRNCHQEIPVTLDKTHPDEAYQLGRLFAALEKTQEEASEGELKSTIKDRYFGAASATPASVFPRLLRLHQHHLNKLEGGRRINREKLVTEICSNVSRFPAHLSLEKQGLFYIAYYHQRQDFFTKKETSFQETSA